MATMTKIGPADQGRRMTYAEFMSFDYEEGYRYELIDGALAVTPLPNPEENVLERWLDRKLVAYWDKHPEIISYVSAKTRVFVPGRRRTTCPEPDLAVYKDFPRLTPLRNLHWKNLHPILVVEVLTGDSYKDLVRNVELYLQVPSIREYWVLDARDDPERPTLIQHRRRGSRWIVEEFPFGSLFTTPLLPGFQLRIAPRK